MFLLFIQGMSKSFFVREHFSLCKYRARTQEADRAFLWLFRISHPTKGRTVMKTKNSKSKKSIFETGTNDNYDRENYINGLTIVKTASNSQSASATGVKKPLIGKSLTPTGSERRNEETTKGCKTLYCKGVKKVRELAELKITQIVTPTAARAEKIKKLPGEIRELQEDYFDRGGNHHPNPTCP